MGKHFDLTDRVIIITGGGKGIGRVYAEEMASLGARVVTADIDGESAEAVAAAIRQSGGQALGVRVDIADADSCDAMAAATLDAFGTITGLVNNAALMSTLPRRSWFEIPVEEWDKVMDVNLRGLFQCCRAVYPTMRDANYGKIVNISSSRIWDGSPNRLHYTTSKAGVFGFTRALASEVGSDNITVNAVTPGFTLSDTQIQNSDPQYLATRKFDDQLIKRAQVPDDLVGAVMFFMSGSSDFISGQTLNIDGGRTMH